MCQFLVPAVFPELVKQREALYDAEVKSINLLTEVSVVDCLSLFEDIKIDITERNFIFYCRFLRKTLSGKHFLNNNEWSIAITKCYPPASFRQSIKLYHKSFLDIGQVLA